MKVNPKNPERYQRFTFTYLPGAYLAGDHEISNSINKDIDDWLEVTDVVSYRITNITVEQIGQAIFHQVHVAYITP